MGQSSLPYLVNNCHKKMIEEGRRTDFMFLHPPLGPVHTERKRTFSLMFAVYSLIIFACRSISYALAPAFAWCE